MDPRRVVLAPLLGLMLAACGPGAGSSPSEPPNAEDLVGAWQLIGGAIDGEPVPILEESRVTAVFEDSTVGGSAACNSYGGRLSTLDAGVRVEVTSVTEMACAEPAMDLEALYLGALSRVDSIAVVDGELRMRGAGVELLFERLEPPPTAALLDTTWRLETLVVGGAASTPMGEPATLEIKSDGTFAGSTGCRTFEGRWIEYGDQIDTPEWGLSGECPAELSQQDSHVVAVIEAGFIPTVDGDRLTLIDPAGDALVYRAQE